MKSRIVKENKLDDSVRRLEHSVQRDIMRIAAEITRLVVNVLQLWSHGYRKRYG